MKTNRLLLIAALLFNYATFAQNVQLPLLLKSGKGTMAGHLTPARLDSLNTHIVRLRDKAVAVVQFETLPTDATRKEMAANGVLLLQYLPQNAYTVSITGRLNYGLLHRGGVRFITTLTPKQKLHPALVQGAIPGWAANVKGTVDVQVAFPKTFTVAEIETALKEKQIKVLSSTLSAYGILSLRIAINRLEELAEMPFVMYVQPALPKDQPLNFNSRITSRGIVLNTAVADGGRGLNGEGVVMGIGDNADVQFHTDFSGRLINRTQSPASYHGTHTHGTAAGGGIINELYCGYAPKATIVSQDFSNILAEAPVYVQDYGMVVTNNSYGVVAGCAYNGGYDLYSYILDQQAFDMPYLQHVFATGNSGADVCAPYPAGFHTVLGSYQSAKNVLCVGNADYAGTLSPNSSKGPVNDGRIKPEITAMGTGVISSTPTNGYGFSSGTSMAAPAVAGGLALLYQRYRQLHSTVNPPNGLMKALLCNGATDRGTSGPDYSYGFGFLNLERSVEMLENNQYLVNNIVNGGIKSHTITVPANTAQLKVMLYWNDPASAAVSSVQLVNDLDLNITSPSSVTTYPKILNPAPGSVTAAAVEGPDHTNNIEQVVLNNPPAGTYTINIQGSIAENPTQEYYVVYDFIPTETKLVFPAAGSALTPGEQTYISWDSYGGPANTFTLEYATDNGATWNPIATNIAATARTYAWTVPNQSSNQVLVRIKRDGTSIAHTSPPFTIIGTPTAALAPTQCEGYINLTWSAVTNATDYEVFLLRGSDMALVASTMATTYTFSGLSKDSTYWVGVRARIAGKPGRRSPSVSRKPDTGTCTGALSDNDLKLNAIETPRSGRIGTSTELHTAAVQVEIKNLDDAPATAFTIGYRVDNGTWVFENVSVPVAAGGLYTHTFSTNEDFSAVGNYRVTAVVKNNTADVVATNDTATRIIKQIANAPISLATPFVDNLETASVATYTTDTMGLENLSRYDFTPAGNGRLRTFINTGVALSGSKALAVDIDRTLSTPQVQYLTGTYNLSGYTASVNDVRLQFNSRNGGDAAHPQNRVWVRGADTQPWIEAYTPTAHGASASIEVANLLAAQGQNFSASFQVRWGVPALGQVVSQSVSKGFLLDDVQLYQVFNDLQLLRIDTPYALNCGLSNAVPVRITLRNSSNAALTNVPVRYKINNKAWVIENVASVPARATVQYTFTAQVNLSAVSRYELTAEVAYASDTYTQNNQVTTTIYNAAVVTSFPYLQNFESGAVDWYADGVNTSWDFGTPESAAINGAASGVNAWKTNLKGNYNDSELSYLYSPCFSIAGMSEPTISFNVALDLEDCGATLCDGAWLEYSTDNKNWYNLADFSNAGTNWYKAPFHVWSVANYTAWHVATMKLPTGFSSIRFRFVLRSDGAATREGIALDDIHIYDNTKGIYTGPTLSAPVTQTVSGNSWVNFESSGQLVASILPNNQNMGSTDVQAYINTGSVRFTGNQYYHNRNITIKPANGTLGAPATVRLYFLDAETNALINATGCTGCNKPASVLGLGVSKFSASNLSYENGTISDNANNGIWSFITPANVVKVPFDKGYYAEFAVKDFSEFWLSAGDLNNNTPLPVRLLQFTAKQAGTNAVLQWTTADEIGVSRYEIEVARSNEEWRQARYQTIGAVESWGDTAAQRQYTFEDSEPFKSGVRYYRIKMVDKDGTFRYSDVRSVLFSASVTWHVYPNPSPGPFYFVYQAALGEAVTVKVQDATGRTVKEVLLKGTGFLQKAAVELTGRPAGVYLLQVRYNGMLQRAKLFKQ